MQWSTVEPNLLASASQDGFVKLWRMPASLSALPELAPIASISVSSSASANINARALSLSCHPLNHEQLAVASTEAAEHSASVWNVDTGAMQTRLTGHTDSIMSVRWSAGGNLLATCAKDRMVHIYEPRAATSPVAVCSTSMSCFVSLSLDSFLSQKVTAHDSALPSRLIWLPPLAGASDSAHFISIGYSRQRALHVSIWDIRSLEQVWPSLTSQTFTSSSYLMFSILFSGFAAFAHSRRADHW
jgi:WD40 repeat protein